MEENFRILDGDELFGRPNHKSPESENSLTWVIGVLVVIFGMGTLVVLAFREGKETVMPGVDKGN